MTKSNNVDSQSNAPTHGITVSGVAYTISGGDSQTVTFHMNDGQQIASEKGAMSVKSSDVQMSATFRTSSDDSLAKKGWKAIKRKVSGESLTMVEYTSRGDNKELSIPVKFPGEIIPVHLEAGQELIMQRGAYLCSDDEINPTLHVDTNIASALFGGEGLLIQKVTGPGTVFMSTGGNGMMRELKAGEKLSVGTGYLAAWDSDIQPRTETNTLMNMAFSGEGAFNTVVEGPGRIWLQSMPPYKMVEAIKPYLPQGQDGRFDGADIVSGLAGNEGLRSIAGNFIAGALRN